MNAQHLSKSENWGTPPEIIRFERRVMGRIDLDPSSSEEWNFAIGAIRIIDEAQNGLKTPWAFGAPRPDDLKPESLRAPDGHEMTVHVNSPGDKRGLRVAAFWCASAGYVELGWATELCWVGFSVEQLSRLQRVGAMSSPAQHPYVIPDERVSYMRSRNETGDQPGHASFIAFLSRSRIARERFCDLATDEIGDVTIPYKRKSTR